MNSMSSRSMAWIVLLHLLLAVMSVSAMTNEDLVSPRRSPPGTPNHMKPQCIPSCECEGKSSAECIIYSHTGSLMCLKEWKTLVITLRAAVMMESWLGFCSSILTLRISGNRDMNILDPRLFSGLSHLKTLNVLEGVFHSIGGDLMLHLPDITTLKITKNSLESLEAAVFATCPLTTLLDLTQNHLKYLEPFVFQNCSRLQNLHLEHNALISLTGNTFSGLRSLTKLFLQHNHVEQLASQGFVTLSQLKVLNLSHNKIRYITATNFLGLSELLSLFLEFNSIESIDEDAFMMLFHLKELSLRGNALVHLHPKLFQHCKYLQVLDLSNNRIHAIQHISLMPLKALQTLKAEKNAFHQLDGETFMGMKSLKVISVDPHVCFTVIPPQVMSIIKPESACSIPEDHLIGHNEKGSKPRQSMAALATPHPSTTVLLTEASNLRNTTRESPMNDIVKVDSPTPKPVDIQHLEDKDDIRGANMLSQSSTSSLSIHQLFSNASLNHIALYIVFATLILLLLLLVLLQCRWRMKNRRKMEITRERSDGRPNGRAEPMSLHPLIASPSHC